jgi:hypothetical protein
MMDELRIYGSLECCDTDWRSSSIYVGQSSSWKVRKFYTNVPTYRQHIPTLHQCGSTLVYRSKFSIT